MVARSKRDIVLVDEQHVKQLEAERAQVVKMVAQFDRKQIKDTYWHKTLVRLDGALEQLKGVNHDG